MQIDQTDFQPDFASPATHLPSARRALTAQAQAVACLAERLDDSFDRAVNMMLACNGRVVVCGMGKSGLVGKKIVATLASTGTPSFFLHPGEAFHGDLGMLMPADIVILISYSGETEEVTKLLPSLRQFGNPIIAMTGKRESTLAKHANVWLDVLVEREVCPNNLAPTTSTLVTMAMGDALAVALIEARKFMPNDFARFHPGGSLGRRLLTRVGDVMRRELPVVAPATRFHDCLFKMTEGRMGLAVVIDAGTLVGIVTDGDLRRALLTDSNLADLTVNAFMHREPVTVNASLPIAQAEEIMIATKIKALIVTDDATGHPVGILEIFN